MKLLDHLAYKPWLEGSFNAVKLSDQTPRGYLNMRGYGEDFFRDVLVPVNFEPVSDENFKCWDLWPWDKYRKMCWRNDIQYMTGEVTGN